MTYNLSHLPLCCSSFLQWPPHMLGVLLLQDICTWCLLFPRISAAFSPHLPARLCSSVILHSEAHPNHFIEHRASFQYCYSLSSSYDLFSSIVLISKILYIPLSIYSSIMEALWRQEILFTVTQCLEQCLAHIWLSISISWMKTMGWARAVFWTQVSWTRKSALPTTPCHFKMNHRYKLDSWAPLS